MSNFEDIRKTEIRRINNLRGENGFSPLPINENDWYEYLYEYVNINYPNNPEYAFNIATTSKANSFYQMRNASFNKQSAFLVFNGLFFRERKTKEGYAPTLDSVARSESDAEYESEQWAEVWAGRGNFTEIEENDMARLVNYINTNKVKGIPPD